MIHFCLHAACPVHIRSAGRHVRADVRWAESRDVRLELCCLRIIRVTLHNNIVLMPEDLNVSETNVNKYRRLERIRELQSFYSQQGLVSILLNLMNANNDALFWEVMALLNCMLYQCDNSVQDKVRTRTTACRIRIRFARTHYTYVHVVNVLFLTHKALTRYDKRHPLGMKEMQARKHILHEKYV